MRDTGPASQVLLASVARRYYVAGRSKVEIAEELRLSRFQVARLLDRALASGVVRIEIGHQGSVDLDLSSRLQDAYGLRHVVVVEATAEEGAPLREQLGVPAAALLTEVVTADDVLGVAWARAVSAAAAQVRTLARVPVVQLTGSLASEDGGDSPVELVRRLAAVAGGPAAFFYAPMTLPDARTAAALRSQREVARVLAQVPRVTKAVVGIGLWSAGESTLYDSATEDERRRLHDLGVCAEFSGVLVDAGGCPVDTGFAERMIAPTAEQMARVPEVIAIAYGAEKAPAVLAALRSGLVHGLVTHTSMALALLESA